MLTKIRDGLWVDFSEILAFAIYNKKNIHGYIAIARFKNSKKRIRIYSLEEAIFFQDALEKYYHGDVKSEAKKVMLQYHTAIENLADR